MISMSITEVITAMGVVIATLTIIVSVGLYRLDQRQQRAALTREGLEAIIGACGQFLHPLSEDAPYPILHTAATITKEFCSRLGESPKGRDVQTLLINKKVLLSICVEGWIRSTQINHMMDIVENLERNASSHNLRGKLLLICQASFLLAGIVAKICSPESFYDILKKLEPDCCKNQDAEVILNQMTAELQDGVCQEFNKNYKATIKQCLYFIQIASSALIQLNDRKLVHLSKEREMQELYPVEIDPSKDENLMQKIEQESTLLSRLSQVKKMLKTLENDIDQGKYQILQGLIEHMQIACKALEIMPQSSMQHHT
jgi:hypothetical protein